MAAKDKSTITARILIARSENAMDAEVFNDPRAGMIEAGSLHLERMGSPA